MSNDVDKKGWLTVERVVALAFILMGVGGFTVTVNNLGERVQRLEQRDDERQKMIQDVKEHVIELRTELRAEMKALRATAEDTKRLLEREGRAGP